MSAMSPAPRRSGPFFARDIPHLQKNIAHAAHHAVRRAQTLKTQGETLAWGVVDALLVGSLTLAACAAVGAGLIVAWSAAQRATLALRETAADATLLTLESAVEPNPDADDADERVSLW